MFYYIRLNEIYSNSKTSWVNHMCKWCVVFARPNFFEILPASLVLHKITKKCKKKRFSSRFEWKQSRILPDKAKFLALREKQEKYKNKNECLKWKSSWLSLVSCDFIITITTMKSKQRVWVCVCEWVRMNLITHTHIIYSIVYLYFVSCDLP